MKQGTKFVHAGAEPDPSTGAIMTPIYQTSTYVQSAPGVNKGLNMHVHKTQHEKRWKKHWPSLKTGKYGLAFSSGVAATDAVIKLLQPGDEIITGNDLYGGTVSPVHQSV
jgi:cystathionine beta-lyase/cystathionine gamma-synthase